MIQFAEVFQHLDVRHRFGQGDIDATNANDSGRPCGHKEGDRMAQEVGMWKFGRVRTAEAVEVA
jgi:hypothetical protein